MNILGDSMALKGPTTTNAPVPAVQISLIPTVGLCRDGMWGQRVQGRANTCQGEPSLNISRVIVTMIL
jgi:hypothetical protein